MSEHIDKSKAGYVKIHRSMFDNPLFNRHPEYIGPWVWMIAQARFKANGIGRGQLELSLRFLRQKFPFFSHAKCQRFFDTLINTQMVEIDTQSDTRGRLITICNYDKYQSLENDTDTPCDTKSSKTDTQTDTRIKKVKEGKKEISSNDDILFAFDQFRKFAEQSGLPVPRKCEADRKRKLGTRLKKVGRQGWVKALRRAERSDLILGANWFSIDWLIKNDTNIVKVLEGNYDNKAAPKPKTAEEIANEKFIERVKRENEGQPLPKPANGGSLLF